MCAQIFSYLFLQLKDTLSPASINSVLAYGVKNYLPERPVSEDDISIEKHISLMTQENNKTNPNYILLTSLMDMTFADRRKLLINDMQLFESIKIKYPCLFNAHQV